MWAAKPGLAAPPKVALLRASWSLCGARWCLESGRAKRVIISEYTKV